MILVKGAVVWDSKNKKTIEKTTTTKGSVREVPMPLFCTRAIKEYLKLRDRIIQRFKNKDYIPPRNLFLSKYGEVMFPNTPSSKWLDFRNRHKEIKTVSLHGLRHSYCTIQMDDNPNLSSVDVKKLMGHSQLSITFIYIHSNEDKIQGAISVFDKYYNVNSKIKLSSNQMLSLYTRVNFVSRKELDDLLKFTVDLRIDEDEKYNMIKQYIDNSIYYVSITIY